MGLHIDDPEIGQLIREIFKQINSLDSRDGFTERQRWLVGRRVGVPICDMVDCVNSNVIWAFLNGDYCDGEV